MTTTEPQTTARHRRHVVNPPLRTVVTVRLAVSAAITAVLLTLAALYLPGLADAAPARTYTVTDETNVSAQERGTMLLVCDPGGVVKSRKITTKAGTKVHPFSFYGGQPRGGVRIDYTGQAKREQTLTASITCRGA